MSRFAFTVSELSSENELTDVRHIRSLSSCQSTQLHSIWFGRAHFESHDTLIEGLRLHPEANGYAKRLLADLQTLAFVPKWTEQVANVEMKFGDVFREGSKLNEWFLSLDLRQFRAAFIRFGARPSSEPSRTRHQRGTTPRTHSWVTRTNRGESSSRSSSKRSFGTGIVSSDRTELKKVNFVAASRPDSPIRPRLRQDDWRQGIASEKEHMDLSL